VDVLLLGGVVDLPEGLGHLLVELLANLLLGPVVAVDVLNPLEVADGNATCVTEEVRNLEDALLAEYLVGLGRNRTVGHFGNYLGLYVVSVLLGDDLLDGGGCEDVNFQLKKLLVDVAKAYLVRETLRPLVPVEYPEGVLGGVDVEFPFEDEHINFTAKHGRWIVVKRLIIDEKTPALDIARLLASINETTTLKIPVYAGIDVEGIEAEFSAFKKVKKSDIPKVIEVYEAFEPAVYADEPFERHAKVYALRTALEKIGLTLDVPAKSLEKYLEKKG